MTIWRQTVLLALELCEESSSTLLTGTSHAAVLAGIQAVVAALKRTIKTGAKAPTEAQLMTKYDKLCIAVDEVIHEVRSSAPARMSHRRTLQAIRSAALPPPARHA